MTEAEVAARLEREVPAVLSRGERVLLIVPDTTRTAPVGMLVQRLLACARDRGARADVMVALGTHLPLAREVMLRHLGFRDEAHVAAAGGPALLNHAWDDPAALARIGAIPRDEMAALTNGMLPEEVPLTLNRRALEYDRLLILGPVFPHEIAGFSGGSKYLFPGVSGPEMIDFFHWLGALITNLKIIGVIDNPVRRVLDAAAARVPVPVSGVALVMHDGAVAHLGVGPLRETWRAAAEVSARLHVVRKARKFRRALSCCPPMYDDFWTGGKCMYKVEPVIEDGGEIVIYAPHVDSFSVVHGEVISRIGYHVRDYFVKQSARFAGESRAVMAVSTLIKGSGTYENGVERPRINVSFSSRIPESECRRMGMGYVDPASIRPADWQGCEDEGILFVAKAGETLYLPDLS